MLTPPPPAQHTDWYTTQLQIGIRQSFDSTRLPEACIIDIAARLVGELSADVSANTGSRLVLTAEGRPHAVDDRIGRTKRCRAHCHSQEAKDDATKHIDVV
jgi:hypothetical protein